MTGYVASSDHSHREMGLVGRLQAGKQFLNALAARAIAAAERSRFAALPSRYLDDVGMTEAERAAAVGYEEPTVDGWRVVASHL